MKAIPIINNVAVSVLGVLLIVFGFTIDSKFYLGNLNLHDNHYGEFLWSLIMGILSFSPSNLIILSVLSCYFGAELAREPDDDTNYAKAWKAAIMRGFLCFATVFFGVGWLNSSMLLEASQKDYYAISGVIVFSGMTIGYDPSRIRSLILRDSNKQD